MTVRTWSCSMGKWPKHFKGTVVGGLLITQLDNDQLIKQLEDADDMNRKVYVKYESEDYSDEIRVSMRYHESGKLVIVCNLQLEDYKP